MRQLPLNLLILCAVLSQVISVLSEENINGSSNLHVRKKRLVGTTRLNIVTIDKVPYIVSLRRNNFTHCGATILDNHILLTAAHCVSEAGVTYNILSGSSIAHFGSYHTVKNLQKYYHYNQSTYLHDLALLYINPPIDLVRGFNRKIEFYDGPLNPGTPVTLTGWGCTKIQGRTIMFSKELRQITVPILSPHYCYHAHEIVDPDKDEHICIADPLEKQGSCYGDTGGPVVIDGKLAGILSWPPRAGKLLPDIAVNLANAAYRDWIRTTAAHLMRVGG